jgi:hypothetical protein
VALTKLIDPSTMSVTLTASFPFPSAATIPASSIKITVTDPT